MTGQEATSALRAQSLQASAYQAQGLSSALGLNEKTERAMRIVEFLSSSAINFGKPLPVSDFTGLVRRIAGMI